MDTRRLSFEELQEEAAKPLPPTMGEALVKVEALITELSHLAVQAAEERYPGIEKLVGKLLRAQSELANANLKGQA